MELIDIFCHYFEKSIKESILFVDDLWISSNSYYIFFGDNKGKTYVLFSKKYYLTIELTKNKKSSLDKIAEIISEFRNNKGLEISKYQFWLPHCLVNGVKVDTKLIAESYGVSRELALEYLIQYDEVFAKLYNKYKKTYFGLKLYSEYEEAESIELKDNTQKYLKGLKLLKNIL